MRGVEKRQVAFDARPRHAEARVVRRVRRVRRVVLRRLGNLEPVHRRAVRVQKVEPRETETTRDAGVVRFEPRAAAGDGGAKCYAFRDARGAALGSERPQRGQRADFFVD